MILIVIGLIGLGLIVGSFLNMLTYRLPLILKHEWRLQSYEILKQSAAVEAMNITLAAPRSFCPHCQSPLKLWHNIPLLSYIFLGGHCGFCRKSIPIRYLITEISCAIIPVVLFYQFGFTWPMYAALILSWGLIAVSIIDIEEMFIPDSLTLSLLWLGLIANVFYLFTTPENAIIGATVGYIFFWCIAKSFSLLRNKEGLGYVDFKLLAMLGAWFGIYALFNIVLIASITGIVTISVLTVLKRRRLNTPFPFGPFLALGGWCTLFFGDTLTNFLFK